MNHIDRPFLISRTCLSFFDIIFSSSLSSSATIYYFFLSLSFHAPDCVSIWVSSSCKLWSRLTSRDWHVIFVSLFHSRQYTVATLQMTIVWYLIFSSLSRFVLRLLFYFCRSRMCVAHTLSVYCFSRKP